MFQRAARVGALEEEIERLALESQKLKLEALSEKKLADKRARRRSRRASPYATRASIDDALVQKVAVATSALRAELATLQGDHDMLASAVATLTEERDAARADASAEATRALQTATDEKASVARERDAFKAELDVSKREKAEATQTLADRDVELDAARAELASAREALARADGEAAARQRRRRVWMRPRRRLIRRRDGSRGARGTAAIAETKRAMEQSASDAASPARR